MAAVFCFVFLFALASITLLATSFGTTVGGIAAFATFTALAAGVFGGLFTLTREWEAEAGPEH